MKKIPFSILKRLNQVFRSRFSTVSRGGVRLILDKNNWIDNRLLSFRGYERKNIAFFVEDTHVHTYDLFLDVGANIGYFTTIAGVKTNIPRILSFEPLQRNYNQLCGNIFINGLNKKVTTRCAAVGQKNEVKEIHFNESSTGIATLNPEDTGRAQSDYSKVETIKCIHFDKEYDLKGQRVFIKMDVEGFEYNTLQGMQAFLKNNKVTLLIEINNEYERIQKLLDKLGFAAIETSAEDYVFRNFTP